jgi:hypothetical protein
VAARPAVPNEKPNPTFALFVQTMLKRGAPTSMILNKSLLSPKTKITIKNLSRKKQNK